MRDRAASKTMSEREIAAPRDAEILLALDLRYPYGVASRDIADYLRRDGPFVTGSLRRMQDLGLVKREPEGLWFLTAAAHRAVARPTRGRMST